MDINDLVKLTSKAWAIPILAQFGAGVPGRQAPLLSATGASRTAFAQSMQHLQDIGLVEKTAGHGHPLRPEYQLTTRGTPLAAPALSILELVQDTPQATLIRRMWVLPLLAASDAPRPFGALTTALSPITDRALSQALRQLQSAGWIHRDVDITARPPRATYQSQSTGALIGHEVRTMLETTPAPGSDEPGKKAQRSARPNPTLG